MHDRELCVALEEFERTMVVVIYISNMRDSDSWGFPNTEKIVENRTRSGVFLTKFEVFG